MLFLSSDFIQFSIYFSISLLEFSIFLVACRPIACNLNCENGLVKDSRGCDMCECQAPRQGILQYSTCMLSVKVFMYPLFNVHDFSDSIACCSTIWIIRCSQRHHILSQGKYDHRPYCDHVTKCFISKCVIQLVMYSFAPTSYCIPLFKFMKFCLKGH